MRFDRRSPSGFGELGARAAMARFPKAARRACRRRRTLVNANGDRVRSAAISPSLRRGLELDVGFAMSEL
jgi:hypothetical protein